MKPVAAVSSPVARKSSSRAPLLWLALICILPIVLAYLAYFKDWRPNRSSNFGTLIEPQRPMPALPLRTLDGRAIKAEAWRGQWSLITADGGACGERCAYKLHAMRQIRLSLGANARRLERVWLILDDEPLSTLVIRAYDGTQFWRADAKAWSGVLPHSANALTEELWLVDPRGNLMMRFPAHADPLRIRKDISRLLFASQIG